MSDRIIPRMFEGSSDPVMLDEAGQLPWRSVLQRSSPYFCSTPIAMWWLSWASVLRHLERFDVTGQLQSGLSTDLQRPGARVGLVIGLCLYQLGVVAEWGWPEPTEARDLLSARSVVPRETRF